MNKKKIFSFIREHPESSRKDISQGLGLSFGTIATICTELINEGIVESMSAEASNGGRIPDLLSLKADARHIACLDLIQKGQVTLALCDLEGKISSSVTWDSSELRSFQELKNSIDRYYHASTADAGIEAESVVGISVAVPAIQSRETGIIIHSTNPLLENASLAAALEEILHVPVLIENESNLMVTAIAGFENGNPARRDIVYLYLNEGLGAGIICNGKLLSGSRGLGGEVNHLPLGRRGYTCYCGNTHCVETELSMAGFLCKYREDSGIDLGTSVTAWHQFEHLVAVRDPRALAVCHENAHILAGLMASLCNLFDPEKVCIGGILDDVFVAMQDELEREFHNRLAVPHYMNYPIALSNAASGLLLRGCVESVVQQWVPGPLPPALKEGVA